LIPTPRELLAKYGLAAKKSWGQNFLVDEGVYRRIVDAARIESRDTVVEIGAGLGTLTARLAERAARVVAIERDRDMVRVLRGEWGAHKNVEITEANALTLDYSALGRVIVVGNLPYQIASQLLIQLVAARAQVVRVVVMLQLEMARRVAAQPATRDYSSLTVAVATFCDVELLFKVGRGAFFPAPRVDSATVRLTPLAAPRAPISDPAHYESVVRAAFGQRRKTLRNALRAVFPEANAALERAGIDGDRRGETLSIEEFARIAEALHA
jgi:16S rRNA (adenine1518-N6/adenine1519-N6)-dimethyltransferase